MRLDTYPVSRVQRMSPYECLYLLFPGPAMTEKGPSEAPPSFDHLRPDVGMARTFLEFFGAPGADASAKHIFLWLPPGKAESGMQEILSVSDFCKVLPGKQSLGYQPFLTINAMKGRKRSNAEVSRYRAYFLDFDKAPTKFPHQLPPDCVVRSKNGQHWYWRTEETSQDQWRAIEIALATEYGADLAATDPARVLRVPGAWHVKDVNDPFLVTLEHCVRPEFFVARGSPITSALLSGIDLAPYRAEAMRLIRGKNAGSGAVWDGTEANVPANLKEFLRLLSDQGIAITHAPGKPEWYVPCPLYNHKHARVCILLQPTGDFTLFCQSKNHGCTRDGILEKFGVGWGIRYQSKY